MGGGREEDGGVAPPRSSFFGEHARTHTRMPAAEHAPARGSSPPRASPGSHSSALQVSREGLKLSPPTSKLPGGDPVHPTTDILPSSKSPPIETHLWIAPATKRKRTSRGAAVPAGGGVEGGREPARIPPQSPVRPVEWWRRAPSPLLVHLRPLWQSSSGGSNSGSDLSIAKSGPTAAAIPSAAAAGAAAQRGRARGRGSPPSEGEAAAGGEAHYKLDRSRVCACRVRSTIRVTASLMYRHRRSTCILFQGGRILEFSFFWGVRERFFRLVCA